MIRPPLANRTWVTFKNTASETIPAYGVMRITGTDERAGRTVYNVAKPNTTFQRLYLVNGPVDVPASGYGDGTFDITYALCSSAASPLLAESWGAKHDEWKLFQYRPGFFMLGNYQGTGDAQRAIVRPYEVQRIRGTLDATLSQGSSASFNVYFRDGNTWTDSTMNVTVYDDLLATSASLSSTTVGWADWYGDRWWLIEARCA